MSKGFASNPRIALLAGAIFLAFGAIGFQLVNLHVVRRDELIQFVEKSRRRIAVEPAQRGEIIDSHGAKLATSRTEYIVWADPQVLRPEDEEKWPLLAGLLGLPLGEVSQKLTKKYRVTADAEDVDGATGRIQYTKLKEGVDKATNEQIASLKIAGVKSDRVYSRYYPHNQLAAHVVGYVNKAEIPATGIEAFSDFFLRGRNGWREGERDARGRELAQFRSRDVQPVDGYSVRLSLDANIQSMIEDELNDLARRYSPHKATIIVSDAETGFILGLGNFPTFDPNEYGKSIADRRNVAVADIYEPGSVFKIVAAAAALEEGKVTSQSLFDVSLPTMVYNQRTVNLPDEDHRFDHPLKVSEIISHSSNRGAVRLAMLLGEEKYYNYVRAFGFGQDTGFPVGAEVPGLLIPLKEWDRVSRTPTISRVPMGHSVSVTVMQMHQAMSVIASKGMLMKPQIVSEIRDADGVPVYTYRPEVLRQVISRKTAETMAQMLMGVASPEGTAPNAAIPGFQVGGKTGTTQKIIDGAYSTTHHVASFVGFFPASQPRVVISVIVDDADANVPGGVAYGSKVAAPAFKHLGELLIPYLDIRPVLAGAPAVALQGGRP